MSTANYAYWQQHGRRWINEYQLRRTREPGYGLEELVLAMILERAAPARVLEYGCGVGRHLSYLSAIEGLELYGVDQSSTMLEGISLWVADKKTADRTRLIDPNGSLPFDRETFDIAFTAEVLVHVRPEDLDGRLSELVRVTRGAILHLETAADCTLSSEAHDGCWYHDLVAAYGRLGIIARRVGRPTDEHELIVAQLDPAYSMSPPGKVVLDHMRQVQSWWRDGMKSASSEPPCATHMNSIPPTSTVAAVATLASTETKMVEGAFADLPGDYRERVNSRMRELDLHIARKVLTHEVLRSGAVVDWEARDCAFAVAMLRMGAPRVFAIDRWLDESLLPPALFKFPGLFVTKSNIHDFAAVLAIARITVDLVFSNTVTEHIQDLIGSLSTIRRILKSKGYFFTNHDNYYQPVGSHDHGFLFYGDSLTIVPQGVECWNSPEKCAASADHRQSIRKQLSWTWADSLDESRDPRSCDRCFYYKRSQPWAHLIYASEFNSLFPTEAFRTGTKNSSLNKITTFQLQQFIRETGFNIRSVNRAQISNVPPEVLLQDPFFFNKEDLRTATIAILAQLL